MPTPMTTSEYVSNGGSQCPFCASTNISGGRPSFDDTTAWRSCNCDDCNKEWTDLYHLVGYEVDSPVDPL